MLEIAIWISLIVLGLAFAMNLLRLIKGPAIVDRLLAVDTLYINGLAIVVVFGMLLQSRLFFEAARLIALFGIFSTAVISIYILRGKVTD